MSDWYRDFANSGVGTTLTKQLGLPRPACCAATSPGDPLLPGPAVIGSAGEGRLRDAADRGPQGRRRDRAVAGDADGSTDGERPAAVILDATGLRTPADLAAAHDFLAPAVKRLRADRPGARAGRPAVRGRLPGAGGRPAGARRARPLGRQGAARGATANLLFVPEGAEAGAGQPGAVLPVRPLGLRRRPGRDAVAPPDGAAERGPERRRWPARSPSSPARRAASAPRSRRSWPATAPTSSPSTSRPPGRRWPQVANEIGGTALQLDITAADAAAAAGRAPARAARRRRRRRPQRRHHPRQAAGQHGRRPLELGHGGEPAGPAGHQRGAARRRRRAAAGARVVCVARSRASPATAARPTTRRPRPA